MKTALSISASVASRPKDSLLAHSEPMHPQTLSPGDDESLRNDHNRSLRVARHLKRKR